MLKPGVGAGRRCHGHVSIHAIGGARYHRLHSPPLRSDCSISLAHSKQCVFDSIRGEERATICRQSPESIPRAPRFPVHLLLGLVVGRKSLIAEFYFCIFRNRKSSFTGGVGGRAEAAQLRIGFASAFAIID